MGCPHLTKRRAVKRDSTGGIRQLENRRKVQAGKKREAMERKENVCVVGQRLDRIARNTRRRWRVPDKSTVERREEHDSDRGNHGGRGWGNEEELMIQETLVRNSMDMKDLRSKNQTEWKVKEIRRLRRKESGTERPLRGCFETKEGVDYVYHRRKISRGDKISARWFENRRLKDVIRLVRGTRRRKWKMSRQGGYGTPFEKKHISQQSESPVTTGAHTGYGAKVEGKQNN